MFKQFLGKLPRKASSKNPPNDSNSTTTTTTTNTTTTTTTTSSSSSSNGLPNRPPSPLDPLPSLRDVPPSEKPALLLRKLSLCSLLFDFSDPSRHLKEKDLKRHTLLELVDYVSSPSPSPSPRFPDPVLLEAVRMVSSNLFRAFPPSNHDRLLSSSSSSPDPLLDSTGADEDEPILDPAWPHLQIVYEFLLRLVSSPDLDAKAAKRFVDHAFVLRLLDLFDSEDQREREYLKTVLHRVYGKFMVHRPFIRKAINNIFFRFIFETEKHNGVAELLEILGSIINGFALPLKEEHKLFLVRALVPLHKPKCAAAYHQQLSYCVTQFVEKDFKLADAVIRGLLKYWPVTNSSKEVMFLGELEEVLEATQPAEFQRCMVPLFKQIARCLNSSHFQVAERALFLWNNDHIRNLIVQNRKVILPIIFPALERNTKGHWNQAVQSLTLNVRKLLIEADQELFGDCLLRFKEDEAREREAEEKRRSIWKRLEEVAATRAVSNDAILISRTISSLTVSATPPPRAAVGT